MSAPKDSAAGAGGGSREAAGGSGGSRDAAPSGALVGGTAPSPLGTVHFVLRGGALVALDWEDHRDRLDGWLSRRFGVASVVDWDSGTAIGEGATTTSVAAAITRYFAGDLDALAALAVDPGGTPFQAEVWVALRRIAPGRTSTYAGLAAAIGKPAAVRAVGAANGANPISLVLPCHRVIGADGALTGYAGGLRRKRWLLAHEHAGQGVLFAGTIPR